MARVIQAITYDVIPEERVKFLKIIKSLKSEMVFDGLEVFAVSESSNKKNNFQELYVFNSTDVYENYEDMINDKTQKLIEDLQELIVDNTTEYKVFNEVK